MVTDGPPVAVVLLDCPAQAEPVAALAQAGSPRLLLVAPDADPRRLHT